MQRKKILWLVSWYPNKNDAFDGDFIQRHARAAAIYHDIHVIFVTGTQLDKEVDEVWNYATGLTEQLIYFRETEGFFGRIRKQWKWRKLFQKAVAEYVSKNGQPQLVHIHVPWKSGLIGLWMKRKFRTSYILSEHWGIYSGNTADQFNNRPGLMKGFLKKIFHEAGKIIVVSEFLGKAIEKTIGAKAATVIPNVVDTTMFHLQVEKYSRFSFIHVSNMVPLKNADLVLVAFHELVRSFGEDVQLIMIGNRSEDHKNLAKELGILNRSVFFKGEIPYHEVAEEVRRSHCFVLFSDSETFSCVSAEALCCGLPVISSSVGALPELVNHGNGVLLKPKNVEELTAAMRAMVEHYASFDHQSISKQASERYGYAAIADKFRDLYESEVGSQKSAVGSRKLDV